MSPVDTALERQITSHEKDLSNLQQQLLDLRKKIVKVKLEITEKRVFLEGLRCLQNGGLMNKDKHRPFERSPAPSPSTIWISDDDEK